MASRIERILVKLNYKKSDFAIHEGGVIGILLAS